MAKPTFPFFDMDVTKLMGDFRLPGFDLDGLAAVQRRNFEAVVAANQLAVEGAQTALKRQAELARQAVEDASGLMNELFAVGAPEEKLARQADYVKASVEKTLGGLRELGDTVAKTNTQAAEMLGRRVVESLDEVKALAARKKPAASAKAA